MSDAINITERRLLLVEGRDAVSFFETLVKKQHLPNPIQILDFGSVNDLRSTLEAVKLASDNFDKVTHVGIVRDYERTPNPRQSITDALTALNMPVPSAPNQIGGDGLKVIYTLLPDADTEGMLEDLCLRAFESDLTIPCIDDYFECLSTQGIKLVNAAIAKAKMNILFASKSVDDSLPRAQRRVWQLHYAVMKNWWNWDHPAFDSVKAFLHQLAAE